jgi:hypothetical protein
MWRDVCKNYPRRYWKNYQEDFLDTIRARQALEWPRTFDRSKKERQANPEIEIIPALLAIFDEEITQEEKNRRWIAISPGVPSSPWALYRNFTGVGGYGHFSVNYAPQCARSHSCFEFDARNIFWGTREIRRERTCDDGTGKTPRRDHVGWGVSNNTSTSTPERVVSTSWSGLFKWDFFLFRTFHWGMMNGGFLRTGTRFGVSIIGWFI